MDLDGVKALHRAGYKPKNAVNAARMASELLRDPVCKVRINELMSVRAEKVGIDAEQVLQHYVAIALADPRKLMQHVRGACRYCHGIDHAFQWKTEREFSEARAEWEVRVHAENERDRPRQSILADLADKEPSAEGGFGYRRTAWPNPNCPECDGLGIGFVVLADTRNLDAVALRLFDGVKETTRGIEMKIKDQLHALDQVARHIGLFARETRMAPGPDALDDLIRHIQTTGSKAPIVAIPPEVVP